MSGQAEIFPLPLSGVNRASMDPKRLRIDGVEFAYLEVGSGAPLILVHGSLGDFRTWRGQLGPLARHFHAVAYSRRYHYPNPWVGDGSDYSAALHADDLAAIITRLCLAPVHVVGASFGAYTSLVLAVRYPTLVRSLVLGEPPLMPWLRGSAEGQAMWATFQVTVWEPACQAFARGLLAEGVKIFVDGVSGAGSFERMPPTGQQMLMENARAMQAESTAAEYFTPLSCEAVERIAVPVLLLTGERSPLFFHKITDELAQCLSHPVHRVIVRASHAMHVENPQAYTQAVLAFLEGHGPYADRAHEQMP